MKPILFNTEMVRAILEGRKIVTRRVLKEPFEVHPNGFITKPRGNERLCPYEPPYQVGDILYVRETWRWLSCFECGRNMWAIPCKEGKHNHKYNDTGCYVFKANFNDCTVDLFRWRPSIHMPKEAARIFLRVTDVRVEKLHDMKLADFLAEGITLSRDELRRPDTALYNARNIFRELWNSTCGKPYTPKRYANNWGANPYVWVIEFVVISKEEALESD